MVSQKLKSEKLPHICGIFFVYRHCEIHHKCPYNMRFDPGKDLEKSLVLMHQNPWEPFIGLWNVAIKFYIINFQVSFRRLRAEVSFQSCPRMNVTEPH